MFGKGGTVAVRAPRIDVFRVQRSSYGQPIALAWGQPRLPGNLLWYGNFRAIPHTSVEESGGKGGGGVSTETTTYTYEAAVAVGFCEGEITGIGWIWRGKEKFTAAELGFSVFAGVPEQSPWDYLTTNFPDQAIGYEDLAFLANASYLLTENAELHNHNVEIKAKFQRGSVGSLAKTVTADLNANTLNATAHGFEEGWIVRLSTTGVLPYPLEPGIDYIVLNALADSFQLTNDYGQEAIDLQASNTGSHTATLGSGLPWPFTANTSTDKLLATGHPFLNGQFIRLDTTGVLPPPLVNGNSYYVVNKTTNDFQVSLTSGGSPINLLDSNTGTHTATPYRLDANPKDVVNDVLTHPGYGAGFPTSKIADLTQYSDYCLANNILISPALMEQRSAAEFIKSLLDITNSQSVWSDGKLKIVPYGDTAASGNGVAFTPDVTTQYDLTDDDYCPNSGEPPVRQIRTAPADAFNQVQIEFLNRRLQYNVDLAEAKDQANIDLYGLRPKQAERLNEIVEPDVAAFVAQARLQRALYIRNLWRFRLSMKFSALEPMDIVTITETRMALDKWPVRIMSIDESDDGYLEVEAEDFPIGVATPAKFQRETGLGFNANYNAAPGDVNTPVIFTAPGIATATGFELWCAVSGASSNWGGCDVYVSTDGETYQFVGKIAGRARHGVVHTSQFPSGSDPDTVNTLKADLGVSQGTLLPGTQQDADNKNTLCLVGSELIAYSEATLTAANKYDLDTYIRRGVYNSPISAHSVGTRFVRLDQAIFRHVVDATMLGSTIFFKFPSFNIYGGGGKQGVDQVRAYSYVVQPSLSYPSTVASLSVSQNGNVVVFQWPLIDETNIDGYDIRFVPIGPQNPTSDAVWNIASEVTSVTRGTQITTAKVPPGSWTFLIRARDNSGNQSRASAVRDLVVESDFDLIRQSNQQPHWVGAKTGFVKHWTGVLVPDSTKGADEHTNVELFEQFVPYPVASCTYESPEVDIDADGRIRIWSQIAGRLRSDVSGVVAPHTEIDYRVLSGAYDGFQPWTIGEVDARFIKFRLVLDTSDGKAIITEFGNVADALEREEVVSGISIGASGTPISFATPFFNVPYITFEPDESTPKIATITVPTKTGFTGHLYNTSGTQVGGTGKYTAKGV